MSPRVSVILSVHNGQAHIVEAVNSILAQSMTDFEFIIIDDGSSDGTKDILATFKDDRIQLVTNSENIGLTRSLNTGLELASGAYIARMDADDIALPQRLEFQTAYLDAHEDVVLLGTAYESFTESTSHTVVPFCDNDRMAAQLLFNPPLAHPSAMMRTSFLHRNGLQYDTSLLQAQDFDLWSRIMTLPGGKAANLEIPLLRLRKHGRRITSTNKAGQKAVATTIRKRHIKQAGVSPTPEEMEFHDLMSLPTKPFTQAELNRAEAWLLRLTESNSRTRGYDAEAFRDVLGKQWFTLCDISTVHGLDTWNQYLASPLKTDIPFKGKIKLLAKCALKWEPRKRS